MKKIVLTGGPCAGKTTVLKHLNEYLSSLGYNVIIVSETASELIGGNLSPIGDYDYVMNFQNLVLKRQMSKEREIDEFVSNSPQSYQDKTIIIYDRGLLDNRAYLPGIKELNKLFLKNNIKELDCASKYDLVIALVSVAQEDSIFYENNQFRHESPEEAKKLDRKTIEAWLLHDNLNIVMPTATMEEKTAKVTEIINNFLQGKSNTNIASYEVDINKSDFSKYDINNSKFLVVSSYMLTDKYHNIVIINQKKYNGSSFYTTLYYDEIGNCTTKPISQKEVYNIFKKNILMKRYTNHEIRFLDENYNIGKLVSSEYATFLVMDEKVTRYPENIILRQDCSRNRH